MLDLSNPHEFFPERLPRRAEFISWLLAIAVLGTWWVLQANQARFASTAITLFAFLVFSATGTTLGNWMDRRTVLRLDSQGVFFANGLRRVRLIWSDIKTVRVLPPQAGSNRVQVLGVDAHFEFRTLAEFRLNEKIKGRSGFAAGDRILETILAAAHLAKQDNDASYTYYARE